MEPLPLKGKDLLTAEERGYMGSDAYSWLIARQWDVSTPEVEALDAPEWEALTAGLADGATITRKWQGRTYVTATGEACQAECVVNLNGTDYTFAIPKGKARLEDAKVGQNRDTLSRVKMCCPAMTEEVFAALPLPDALDLLGICGFLLTATPLRKRAPFARPSPAAE